ncbi:uncharacterized protein EAE98_003536 [Botrytis deweyae]|uniref:Uncharacterized protein n=1 Tax=Botrytis deweyae TaxID=2478750 RepID=A0ABQ7ITU8_9HELO|nr:uncharacterized protein EAE98_003536 [Botrytis deweyae]KAF7933827.1 hypothetical protein EAE98_003536 [Botrytis deweyae]
MIMLPASHIHSLTMRQTRQTFVEDFLSQSIGFTLPIKYPSTSASAAMLSNQGSVRRTMQLVMNNKPRRHVTLAVFLDLESMQLLIYKAMSCEWLERIVPHNRQRKANSVSQHGITLIPFPIPDYQKVSVYLKIPHQLFQFLDWER